MKSLLKLARELASPTKTEEQKINSLAKNIIKTVNVKLKKSKVNAKLIIGGSVAKGTWLPGISDIDFFMQFNYQKYKNKSAKLDDIAEKVLKKCFGRLTRLHGSRDYFSLKQEKYTVEIVPVLKITNPKQAKNITDHSPLHVNWVKTRVKKKPKLIAEIRLAKQFFKANKLYGAESHIKGFSGHVIEILVSKYGSFQKFVKGISKWQKKQVIDIEKHKTLKKINPAKCFGPLVIIDPVEAERNAAAAVSLEKFNLAAKICKKFLLKPSIEFFKAKPLSIKALIARKGKRKLIILKAMPEKRKPDIAGAKLLKKFKLINKELTDYGFKILKSDWLWEEGPALFWFYLDKKQLSKTKLHCGPPASIPKEHISAFKRKWKGKKIKKIKGRYCVELKREFTKPELFLKNLIKPLKNIKIISS